jgi:hypothetical protein
MKNFISLIWLNKNDPEKLADKTSQDLVLFALNSAFKVFRDNEFRSFFNYTKQPRAEQDRLFNELGLTSICLLLFAIEDISYLNDEERYFWQNVKEKIPIFFEGWLLNLGIDKKHINIWSSLIEKRCKEYQRCQVKYRQIKNSYDKDFANDENERLKDFYIRYQAVSIGSLFHFRKKGTDIKDPLLKYLKTWLSVLNGQIEKKVKI